MYHLVRIAIHERPIFEADVDGDPTVALDAHVPIVVHIRLAQNDIIYSCCNLHTPAKQHQQPVMAIQKGQTELAMAEKYSIDS